MSLDFSVLCYSLLRTGQCYYASLQSNKNFVMRCAENSVITDPVEINLR